MSDSIDQERAWDESCRLSEENERMRSALTQITLMNIGKDPAEACCNMQEIAAEALKGRK